MHLDDAVKYNLLSYVGFVSRLQRLRMYDMPAVKDKKLVSLLLEEALPAGCVVEGVDFSAAEGESTVDSLPSFVQRYEDLAVGELRERTAVIEQDQQLIGCASGLQSATSTKQDVDEKLWENKKVSS